VSEKSEKISLPTFQVLFISHVYSNFSCVIFTETVFVGLGLGLGLGLDGAVLALALVLRLLVLVLVMELWS